VRVGGGLDDREFASGFFGIFGEARGERAGVGEFAPEEVDAGVFV
jgi:hypothetical protein